MSGNKGLYIMLGSLLLLLLLLSLATNFRFIFFGRASSGGDSNLFSIENSYLFISPLEAKADKTERIRVTVFLLNSEGLGVANQRVSLRTPNELIIEDIQPQTDNYGRAIFDLLSQTPGEYFVEALVNNLSVGEGVKVKFQ